MEASVVELLPAAGAVKKCMQYAVDTTGDVPSKFKCNICITVVVQPVECNSCNQLFCKECLAGWLLKGHTTCPLCQGTVSNTPMNRILKSFLDETKMQGCPNKGCKLAESEMTYEALIGHVMKICSEVAVECPLGCGQQFPRGQWLRHRDAECPKNIKLCPDCEEPIKMGHSCVRTLKAKVSQLE
jgi:E3 ubiquitin-protein ligase NRDP1